MFTIKVIDSRYNSPAENEKVSIEVKGGLFRFGFHPDEYTDRDGEVHYDDLDDVKVAVYLRGKKQFEGYISGRKVFYI